MRTVLAAVLDGTQPALVHLTLNALIAANPAFHNISVTGVQDLSANPIVVNGSTNVGSFYIQILSFQCGLTARLCSNQFFAADSFFVEGNLAPLTALVGDNGRLTDPNLDSVYTGGVPMSLPKSRVTGKAEADLLWNFSHRPTAPTLENNVARTTHLTSDNGPNAVIAAPWADDPPSCLPPSMFTFDQLDFRVGDSYVQNSQIGECRFDYVAFPSTAYLNIALRHPVTLAPTWVVRNFLLPDSGRAAPVEHFGARFPLSYLGGNTGDPVASVSVSYLVTGAPVADADTTQWFSTLLWQPPVLVQHVEVTEQGRASNVEILPTAALFTGWYFPVQVQGDTKYYGYIGCNMPNVELDSTANSNRDINGCVPAACANSLKWLDTTNVNITLPGLRRLYEQLSDLMNRDQTTRTVDDTTALIAKLDLIETYKLPIKVAFQSNNPKLKQDVKSTSGLTSAKCRDTTVDSWPKWGFLAAEAADGEDVELGGRLYYMKDGHWVPTPWGHCVVLTAAAEVAGKPKIGFKHDTDQRHAGGGMENGGDVDTVGQMKFPGPPVVIDGHTVPTVFFVEGVLSESYDPNAFATVLPDTHTFNKYCQEFRRTIPPHTKVTISYPPRPGGTNTTVSALHRSYSPPKWYKESEWNLVKNSGRDYVNNSNQPVTISIHDDDYHLTDPSQYLITLAMSPVPAPQQAQAPQRVQDASSPSNPDEYGGFSLGGTSGGPDEFGSPPGPSVVLDPSIGCSLADVPGRMGAGVSQLTLNRPIPVWNNYWSQVGLHLTISSVHSAGDLLISCPSSGYAGLIHITQPGVYTANLGNVPQTSMFSVTMTTGAGLDLDFDAIGVPSLVTTIAGAGPGQTPRVVGLWNLGPTPSRGPVNLRFDLPHRGKADVAIYDVAGHRIATVLSGILEAGSYGRAWSGHGDDGRSVASGVYFFRLRADREARTARIVISR